MDILCSGIILDPGIEGVVVDWGRGNRGFMRVSVSQK